MLEIVNLVNCYNNEQEVIDYSRMLFGLVSSEKILLVVNVNSLKVFSQKEFEKILFTISSNIFVFNSGNNLGYLNGMLYGYKELSKLRQEIEKVRYVIMSNTDIIINDSTFFTKLLSKEYAKDVGCIGPAVYNTETKSYGNPQYIERYSKQGLIKRIFIFSHPIISSVYFFLSRIKSKIKRKTKQESRYVYSNHGCFFILARNFFDVIKDKEYGCLMYSEEAYIAENIRLNNLREYYDAELDLLHTEGSTTGLLGVVKKSKMFAKSLTYIKNNYF